METIITFYVISLGGKSMENIKDMIYKENSLETAEITLKDVVDSTKTYKSKYLIVKRGIDIFLSLFAIFVFSPVFLIVALVVKFDSEGPIIFKQERSGLHKKPITIYKFRTMTTEAPAYCHPSDLKKDYTTKLGRFLRKTSLDEMPQLFNVLKGDMSLVGPRPIPFNESCQLQERDKYNANDVRPGVTGWAQVNGRNTISIIQKAEYDGYYANHISLRFDLKILFKSVIVVLKKNGIDPEKSETGDLIK